jgi:predicted RNase H-like HicB family nuclease
MGGDAWMKLRIRIIQNEHGDYTALCTSLPGCVSRGSTREEAREKLNEAIRGYIAAVNNFVPEKLLHEVMEA